MQMKLQVLGQRKGNGTRLLSSLNVILCQNVYFLVFLFLRDELLEEKKALHIKITSFVCLSSGSPTNRMFLLNIRELY